MLITCHGIRPLFANLHFAKLTYVPWASSAAWHGTRIILRQVSPESPAIFDFILELYAFCSGRWNAYSERHNLDHCELEAFLEYASTFLSNIGNYYVCSFTFLHERRL